MRKSWRMADNDAKVEKSLRYSLKDGVFSSLMLGFTQDYFTPFLLLLGGTVRHVSVLSALPSLVSAIIQLKSADAAIRLGSRKKVIDTFILLQTLTLLPMIAVYLMGDVKIAAFIAFVTLFSTLGAFVAPVWGSLMADLIDADKRGEYFGYRGKVLGFVAIGAAFAAGFILHEAQKTGALIGFAAIFALAFAFRLVSWYYSRKVHEPPLRHNGEDYFSFFDFISRARQSNFTRFVLFVSLMRFAVNIAAPFFAVLMLRDLRFGYLTYTLITVAATISLNLTIKRWGVNADRIGNLKVVRLTSRLIAFVPLLWLINLNPVYLIIVQLFSGVAWAGFTLSSSNFIYDACSPGKRTRCIAYFNVLNGVSVFLGAIIGGWLAQSLRAGVFAYGILNVVLVSGVLRIIVAFMMPFSLEEVRPVEKMRSHRLFMSVVRFKAD